MDHLYLARCKSVLLNGLRISGAIAGKSGKSRLAIYLDILRCFKKYYVLSSQYRDNEVWKLSGEERHALLESIGKQNKSKDDWKRDYDENRRFLYKYSSLKQDLTQKKRSERYKAYAKRYNAGKGLIVQPGVELSRAHGLWGTIKIGENVLLAKHVFIDYSGEVVIENGVKLTNGVIIETHHHDIEAYCNGCRDGVPTKLLIREKAFIGSRVIILDSCNYIGKCARVGAGAVVTKDVPDYTVVAGVPAKVIRELPHED